jgi:membrane-bound serine protease (ClpP class)
VDRHGRTTVSRLRAAIVLACLVTAALALTVAPIAAQADRTVAATTVDGPITPVIRDHLADTVVQAAQEGHEALVIRLNTPGGGLDVTREIANVLLDAPLPTVVYVWPPGGDAGSAGTFITYAAHIAAMAPATTIGAATPVDLEGGEVGDKIVQNTIAFGEALAEARDRDVDFIVAAVEDGRSVTASTALEEGAIDVVSSTIEDLLDDVDGMTVDIAGTPVTLSTAGAGVVEIEMTGTRSLLQVLANPNLAFIFLSLGTLAILYEIANPGLGLGGVVGVVLLILAMFSLAVLPVNYAAAALLIVAFAMFIAELFMPGVGVGAAGGTAALLLGGLFLFQAETGVAISLWVLVPTAIVTFGLVVMAGILVARARKMRSKAASDFLLGRTVTVQRASEGTPRALVDGTWWRLKPAGPDVTLRDGQSVEVVRRDNLDLYVAPAGATGDEGPRTEETTWTDH